jgi:hypothetical protein
MLLVRPGETARLPPAATGRQAGHDRGQVGDPVAHAFVAARGLGQIPRHSEGRHGKTLPTGSRSVISPGASLVAIVPLARSLGSAWPAQANCQVFV